MAKEHWMKKHWDNPKTPFLKSMKKCMRSKKYKELGPEERTTKCFEVAMKAHLKEQRKSR
jgi:hypothetical protein